STSPVLFIANGKGFAPIKSLVEQAITIDNAESLHLVQLGGNPAGSSLENLCRSWSDSLDNFEYTATALDIGILELSELVAAAILDTSRIDVYLSGPADWLEALFETARSKGLDTTNWHHWAIG
ncbi:MAG: CDP-6-deoxy-L-threo-D-glycero-4-hexulose-3-dehydrase reductase, partial [Gammaproteobacteria bacterium]|nr:CDP-6-deoxy-L-threo-D-glycero-4-hexulose-3-dehydrase reductase [Gammaproteobacteria bacterium]